MVVIILSINYIIIYSDIVYFIKLIYTIIVILVRPHSCRHSIFLLHTKYILLSIKYICQSCILSCILHHTSTAGKYKGQVFVPLASCGSLGRKRKLYSITVLINNKTITKTTIELTSGYSILITTHTGHTGHRL